MELALVVAIVVVARAGLRLHQRLPRRRERDRDLGLDPRADARASRCSWPRSCNFVGALLRRTRSPKTVGKGIIDAAVPATHGPGRRAVAALIGAITWNLITWYFGLPSSSSHALIGGLVGAALAGRRHRALGRRSSTRSSSRWSCRRWSASSSAFLLMVAHPVGRSGTPTRAGSTAASGYAQTASAAAMALGHGLQDAQKTMGVIVLALVVGGYHAGDDIPLWVSSSRRHRDLARHLLRRLAHHAHPRPADHRARPAARLRRRDDRGVRCCTSTAFGFGAPISTTHTITSAIMGVGATKRLSAVRWGVAEQHRRRLGAHDPGRRAGRRRDLPRRPPRHLSCSRRASLLP